MKTNTLEIVVVDDEVMITDLIESFLNLASKHNNIHSFNDSTEAYEYIKNNHIDVLVTDYKMPELDGIALMEATKPTTRRIMISGYVSEIAEKKLRSLDATLFEKPVPMKQLWEIIAHGNATPTP
jgi:YesN/AraC family two-component response regulator